MSNAQTEPSLEVLPQRLRGRGDFLLKRGRIKDAELMYDAATEIEWLRRHGKAVTPSSEVKP